MKGKISTLLALVFFFCGNISGQTTLYSEDFETGGTSFTLNSSDMSGTSTPNFWIVNNSYTGGSGSLMCLGFPFSYTINSTPTQTYHTNTTSKYLHTMSIYGQADNIFCSSFAASDGGLCIPDSYNFCKKSTAVSTVGYQNVTLKFYWLCAGGTNIYGELYYSTNGGTVWNLVTTPISQYKNQTSWVQQTVTLPAFDGVADLRFAFRFVNLSSNTATDPGFSIDDIQLLGTAVGAQTITTGTVSSLSVCPGDVVQVPFTITGSFTNGNVFTAQLSNSSGSFVAPVSIGTLTSTTAGTISCTIPPATPAGTGYRIRVVSSNPVATGSPNVSDITVNALPVAGTAFLTGNNTLCQGSNVQVTLQGFTGTLNWQTSPDGNTWTSTGQSSNPLITTLNATTYIRGSVTNACGTAYSAPVMVNIVPSNQGYAQGILSRDTICTGDTTTVQMIYHGNNITWYTSQNGGTTWNFSANTDRTTYHTPPLNGANQNMVRAIVDNGPCGFDTIDVAITVENVAASFSETNVGPVYSFVDGSTNAVSWAWDFGDGNTSTLQNPVHTYLSGGSYNVTLTVTGPFGCVSTTSHSISVAVGMVDAYHLGLEVAPNPFLGQFEISLNLPTEGEVDVEILDLQGKLIRSHQAHAFASGTWRLSSNVFASALSSGTYLLRVRFEDQTACARLVKF